MANEYFVNLPEYQHIMNLIAQLGGLDLDSLLQRMDAVEEQLSALETWQGTTDTALETITDDIDTIEGNVSDIESAETARNAWHDVLSWGNYFTADQTLLLADDTTNYDFLLCLAGTSNPGAGHGFGTLVIPNGFFNPDQAVTVPFWIGNAAHKVTLQFTDRTHIKIINCTYSGMGLRIITGKKRS